MQISNSTVDKCQTAMNLYCSLQENLIEQYITTTVNHFECDWLLLGFLLIHEGFLFCSIEKLTLLGKNEKNNYDLLAMSYEYLIYFAKLNFVVAITHFLWIPQKINKSRRYVNKLFVNTDRMNEKDIRLLKYYKSKKSFSPHKFTHNTKHC